MCNINLCVKHFALSPTSRTLFEDRIRMASLEKTQPSMGESLIIRYGKEIVINLFDVKQVQLMESLGRDRKYGIGPVDGYGGLVGRVCNRHQKIFN